MTNYNTPFQPRDPVPQVVERTAISVGAKVEQPRKGTVSDELLKDANRAAERIMSAVQRLRGFNERMYGTQPESKGTDGPPVTGMISALEYQFTMQRAFLSELEDQLDVLEGI